LVSQIDPADGVVAQRLQQQQQIYGAMITDPVLRSAQGTAQLAQTVRREANVRAFNDVFALSAVLAMLFLLWSLILAVRASILQKQAAAVASAASAGAATRSTTT
jgi:hypothetical protein